MKDKKQIKVPVIDNYYEVYTYNEHDLVIEERYMHNYDGCLGVIFREYEKKPKHTIVTIYKTAKFPYTKEGCLEKETITVSAEYIRQAGKEILHSTSLKRLTKAILSYRHEKRSSKVNQDGEIEFSEWETTTIKLSTRASQC